MLKDIQNEPDARGVNIQKVGVSRVQMPFVVKKKNGELLPVVADVRFTVALPAKYKGTHMSRFIELLREYGEKTLDERNINALLTEALTRLNATSAFVRFAFKYFVEKTAPVSGGKSLLAVDSFFKGEKTIGRPMRFTMGVQAPYTSLCPCSKEISAFGAHNQRSECRLRLVFREGDCSMSIEDAVTLVDAAASCPVYPLLKREDEKFVTEAAYRNPKFVEDVLRDMVLALRKISGLVFFAVECENFESIHNHNAYAAHEETVTGGSFIAEGNNEQISS